MGKLPGEEALGRELDPNYDPGLGCCRCCATRVREPEAAAARCSTMWTSVISIRSGLVAAAQWLRRLPAGA